MAGSIKTFILLLWLMPLVSQGQVYSVKDVQARSDRALKRVTNKAIAAAAVYDTGTYYSYVSNTGDTTWGSLAEDEKTNDKTIKIFTRYFVHYTTPKCAVYSSINCTVMLQFNNKMELAVTPDLSCIPDFMLKNKNCDLLTAEQAKTIATTKYFVPSDREPTTHLWYDNRNKQFSWSVDGAYLKDSTKKNNYSTQLITIDASTGALISKAKF